MGDLYLEPFVSLNPREPHVRHQEGSHNMPHVIVHPANVPKLPHGSINQWEPSSSPLPPLQQSFVLVPPHVLKRRSDGFRVHIRVKF